MLLMARNTPYKESSYPEHFYPCIKYKVPADEQFHGTNFFTVAESVHPWFYQKQIPYEDIECNLSFTCENHRKVFYRIIEDCSKSKILKWMNHGNKDS